MYVLDTTDVEAWDEIVMNSAFQVIDSYMKSTPCDIQPVPKEQGPSANILNGSELVGEFFCDICERVFIGSLQWQIHLKSNRHHRVLKRKERVKEENKTNSEHLNKIEDEISW